MSTLPSSSSSVFERPKWASVLLKGGKNALRHFFFFLSSLSRSVCGGKRKIAESISLDFPSSPKVSPGWCLCADCRIRSQKQTRVV